MKRSSCASGSSNVPDCSTGFCVAMTRNGAGSLNVSLPIVTFRSCIASSRADCTFGAARLISSASSRLVKIGPLLTRNSLVRWSRISEPEDVRGQQVDGELDAGEGEVDRLGQARDEQRLGQPRHALEQQVAAGEQRDQDALDDDVLPDDDGADPRADAVEESDDRIRGCGTVGRIGGVRV